MTVRGKNEGAAALCRELTPREFLLLVRDVLVMRNHTGIRLMDGPGDGCRDIQSITAEGMQHVTQVAHVRQPRTTVGSRKMGELPNALLKFGVGQGLFVTSGRISPQAKRECIDNYREFEMDFLDGDALADEVLRQVPLKAIWFDGSEFGRVSNRIRVPLLLRDLSKDEPLKLSDSERSRSWSLADGEIRPECRWGSVHASMFTPYRQPESPRVFEGIDSGFNAYEFVFDGAISLDVVAQLCDELARQALERVRTSTSVQLLAVRIGQPVLVPLRGEWAGSSVQVGGPPFTLLCDNGTIVDEWEWLAEVEPTWKRATDLRASTATWLRRYNHELDLCFSIELDTTASEDARLSTSVLTRLTRSDWQRSVFCLVASDVTDDVLKELKLAPTARDAWADGRLLLRWDFRTYAGPFATIMDESDEMFPPKAHEHATTKAFESVRQWIRRHNYELVSPRDARHMVALLDKADPFPTDGMRYRFVDIETGSPIPSPLDPRGRRLLIDACWSIDKEVDEALTDAVARCLADWSLEHSIGADAYVFEFDRSEFTGTWFLHLEVIDESKDVLVSTRERLERFVVSLAPRLSALPATLASQGVLATRATKQYWKEVCWIEFRGPA